MIEKKKDGQGSSAYETPTLRLFVLAENDVLTLSTDVGAEYPWAEGTEETQE